LRGGFEPLHFENASKIGAQRAHSRSDEGASGKAPDTCSSVAKVALWYCYI
jgi:hypothetical protein